MIYLLFTITFTITPISFSGEMEVQVVGSEGFLYKSLNPIIECIKQDKYTCYNVSILIGLTYK